MKTKQKMLTKPITAGFASIFYFKSVKDGIISHPDSKEYSSLPPHHNTAILPSTGIVDSSTMPVQYDLRRTTYDLQLFPGKKIPYRDIPSR